MAPNIKAPEAIYRPIDAVAHGHIAYFRSYCSETIYQYDSKIKKWSSLPECLVQTSLVMIPVNGDAFILHTIGGLQKTNKDDNTSLKLVNAIYRLQRRHNQTASATTEIEHEYYWEKDHEIPPMNVKRKHVTAVCDGKKLIAAGGREEEGPSKAVEVLNIETKGTLKWMHCQDLPRAMFRATGCINDYYMYIFGGYVFDKKRLIHVVRKSAYKVSLSDLFDSCKERKEEIQIKGKYKKIKSVPLLRSTCTTFCGKIYAVGGSELDHPNAREVKSSNQIYEYDPKRNLWMLVTNLKEARSHCFAVSISDESCKPRLMVVGGFTKRPDEKCTSSVEMGSESIKDSYSYICESGDRNIQIQTAV